MPYILLFALAILIATVFCVTKKNFAPLIIIACFVGLGLGNFVISTNNFNNAQQFEAQQQVSGRIVSVRNYSSSQSLVLSNVTIGEAKAGNISVYIVNGNLMLGEKLTFNADVNKVNLFDLGKFSSFYYNNKIFYTTQITESDILQQTQTNLSLKEKIKSKTLTTFLKAMPQDSAYVAYGALFGDTNQIDKNIVESFSKSGIVHILSVSGMHIAFVVAILNFFLSKTKLNKSFRLAFFGFALFFYSYLCSFNLTVVRSSIMGFVLILSTSFGKRYDMLTSIGLSGLIVLMLKPLSVFDIGFQLSYISVFMIAAFSKNISLFFQKLRLPRFISAPLAISLSVQIGIFPLLLKHFNQFSFVSVFSNLVIVPVFEVAFILIFVINIITMVLPFLSFLLLPPAFLINFVVSLSNLFSSASSLIVTAQPESSIFITLFLVAVFVLSGFVMLKRQHKIVLINAILALALILTGIEMLPKSYNNFTVFQAHKSNAHNSIFYTQNEFLLVTDLKDLPYLIKFANTSKIKTFDVVLLTENYNLQNLEDFKQLYPHAKLLTHGESFNGNVFNISYITVYNNVNLPLIYAGGYKSLILNKALSVQQHQQLQYANYLHQVNLCISWQNQQPDFQCDFLIFSNTLKAPLKEFTQLNNWFFELKHATINAVRSLDWNL